MEIETDCETIETDCETVEVAQEPGLLPAADSKAVTPAALKAERAAKARRRAAFFAARDAAFERAGLPIPKIVVRDGVRIENRGVVAGRPSGKSSLQISSKSYYYR